MASAVDFRCCLIQINAAGGKKVNKSLLDPHSAAIGPRWRPPSLLSPEIPEGTTEIGDQDARKGPNMYQVHSRSDPAYDSRFRAATDRLPHHGGRRTGHLRHWQAIEKLAKKNTP